MILMFVFTGISVCFFNGAEGMHSKWLGLGEFRSYFFKYFVRIRYYLVNRPTGHAGPAVLQSTKTFTFGNIDNSCFCVTNTCTYTSKGRVYFQTVLDVIYRALGLRILTL
jgi:hypothetical protein